jgi:hypothetical protein
VLLALLFALGSTLAFGAAAAAAPVVSLPANGAAALVPGQTVEVRWSGLPAGVEEMELLLSLDGGRHFPVRITPDLDADHGSYAWQVPHLPSGAARLALRIRLDGREVIAGRSPLFRIAAGDRASRPVAARRRRDGDLWLGDLDGAGDALGASGFEAGEPRHRLAAGPPAAAASVPPPPPAARQRSLPQQAARHRRAAGGATQPAARVAAGSCPPPWPLRI